jgi:parallel beta-helix repeat protein
MNVVKEPVAGIMLTLLLTSMLAIAFYIQPVRASGTIYIRADGSIDPPIATISSVDNATYTFTDNINDSIVVERDSIVVDGAGYTVSGVNPVSGVDLSERVNVTIKGATIRDFNAAIGVYLKNASLCSVYGNNITDNFEGIVFDYSSNCTISGNNITDSHNVGIGLEFSSNCTISGNNMTNNLYGIWLGSSSNCTISGNNITANHYYGNGGGISVMYSNYSTISGNNIRNNDYGIVMDSSSNNKICHNNFVNNTAQTFFTLSINAWDDGYPSGGNYWDDYSGEDSFKGLYQNETGSDGIGDSPYIIYENIIDKYPLVAPWTTLVGDINQDRTVDIYDAILLSNAYSSSPSSPNWNINADINGDNTVDIYDAIILASNFGKTG